MTECYPFCFSREIDTETNTDTTLWHTDMPGKNQFQFVISQTRCESHELCAASPQKLSPLLIKFEMFILNVVLNEFLLVLSGW